MNSWEEVKHHEWRLFDDGCFTLGRVRHFPTGWQLQWRPDRGAKFQERWWDDPELDAALAWGLAMIRMHQ